MNFFEPIVWCLVPAGFLLGAVVRYKQLRALVPRSYYVAAAFSAIGGLLVGPSCLCIDPLQQLSGALLLSVAFNLALFAATAFVISLRVRWRRQAQPAVQADAAAQRGST